MGQYRHIKKKIKRKHTIIEGFLPLLEQISSLDGVQKIIPAKINPRKTNNAPNIQIKISKQTNTGFKITGYGKGNIQEIYVIAEKNKIEEIIHQIEKCHREICRGKTPQ